MKTETVPDALLYLPLDWWLLVLIVQQAFILARLWARMAGGTCLVNLQEHADVRL